MRNYAGHTSSNDKPTLTAFVVWILGSVLLTWNTVNLFCDKFATLLRLWHCLTYRGTGSVDYNQLPKLYLPTNVRGPANDKMNQRAFRKTSMTHACIFPVRCLLSSFGKTCPRSLINCAMEGERGGEVMLSLSFWLSKLLSVKIIFGPFCFACLPAFMLCVVLSGLMFTRMEEIVRSADVCRKCKFDDLRFACTPSIMK